MSSEDMGLVQSQRLENGLNSHHQHQHQHHHHRHHLVFPNDESMRFSCGAPPAAATQRRVVGGDSAGIPKTRDLSGFIDERFFATPPTDFRRGIYAGERADPRNCSGNGAAAAAAVATTSVNGSEEDDDDEDDGGEDEDMDDDDDAVDGKGNTGNNGSNGEDKLGNVNGKLKRHNEDQTRNHHHHHHHFGSSSSSRDVVVKESGAAGQPLLVAVAKAVSPQQLGSYSNSQNAVTVAENDGGGGGEACYSHYFPGADNGCGFSGRKESCLYLNESGESLRSILSDPVTGALMEDAMILPCGHSFGGGGVQHVIRMKSCYTCSHSISEDSIAPNLSLRAAVQAFHREEELQLHRSAKRKRERFDQDKGVYGDSSLMELPRGKGVQFPFVVTDRVIIKGNKRTPQRFVGREAVVTTQCLNGWYVVKTLDNAESVKLQYRSLAKAPEDPLSKPMSSKMTPNWL